LPKLDGADLSADSAMSGDAGNVSGKANRFGTISTVIAQLHRFNAYSPTIHHRFTRDMGDRTATIGATVTTQSVSLRSRRMKITSVIHSLNGGGAERVMAGLVTRLQRRGHSCTLITLDDATQDRHAVDPAVTRRPLDVMRNSSSRWSAVTNNLRRAATLRRAIAQSKPDVVLSFCDVTNVLTLLASRGLRVPVVVSERSDPKKQKLPWPWSTLRPRLYRHAARVIVLTDTAAAEVTPWCDVTPIVIPSAVDTPTPTPTESSDAQESQQRILLGVGRLEREKGFDRLIDAFATLAPQFPDWKLRIVGDGSCRRVLERQATDAALNDRIEFVGWLQPIWPAYATVDLFALTSRYEGFPSALLEAMASGLAVLSVDCESGPRAIIRDGVNGLLVKDERASIVEGLRRAMSDAELRLRLGNTAREIINQFGWEAMVDAYERVLMQVAIAPNRSTNDPVA
jgi:glycosyltransferase involved in cell wall biosynthesis